MSLRTLIVAGLLGAAPLMTPALAADSIVPASPQFFALSSPDAMAAARWYQEAFGLKVLDVVRPPGDNGFAVILTSDTLLLEIVQAKGSRSPGEAVWKDRHLTHGIFKVGFHVADLDAAVARLRGLETRFETGIIDDARHGLRFVLLFDPDGNNLQLFGKPPAKS